jgi:hypothetical protein
MASLRVRFKDGSTDEWQLKDGMNLEELVERLARSTGAERSISFGAESESGASADYNFVGLAMAEVVPWEMIGMFDYEHGAALWAELNTLPEQG